MVSVRSSIPFCMLLVISLIAPSTLQHFAFNILHLFYNLFWKCMGALTCLRLLCKVSLSFRSSVKCPSVYNWSLFSRALVWSLLFESFLGFSSKRLGMIITAFNVIFFSSEPLIHKSINLVASYKKHLLLLPVGKRKIFIFQIIFIFIKLLICIVSPFMYRCFYNALWFFGRFKFCLLCV